MAQLIAIIKLTDTMVKSHVAFASSPRSAHSIVMKYFIL